MGTIMERGIWWRHEEPAVGGGLPATRESHVWIRGPDAATVVCVDTETPVTTKGPMEAQRVGHSLCPC